MRETWPKADKSKEIKKQRKSNEKDVNEKLVRLME